MVNGCTVTDLDQSIVERASRGDHRAFALLVEHHAPAMRALAFRILGDSASVDDALQEAFTKAFRALPAFRNDSRVGTWLYRICHNVCTDELRRRRRVPASVAEVDPCIPVPSGEQRTLDRDLLVRAFDILPSDLRAAVVLVYVEGLSYGEAAEALSVPVGTVASRVSRARAALRRHLEAPPRSSAA